MTFTVETGSGTPGANALASVAFVTSYLTDRGRNTAWDAAATAVKQAAIIAATDYIETRWGPRFMGSRAQRRVDGRVASGVINFSGQPTNGETVTLGLKTYRFVAALAQENDVLIGTTVAESVANLAGAIGATGLGTTVHEDTQPNYEAAAIDQAPALAAYARTQGENGNLVAWSTTVVASTISGSGTLEDGLDQGEQPLSFPRVGLYTRDGTAVVGVPLKVRQATAEYAERALSATLAPDPTVDATLVPVLAKREKVGPIEEETTYAIGGLPVLIKPYPAADRLLADYVSSAGGAVRA